MRNRGGLKNEAIKMADPAFAEFGQGWVAWYKRCCLKDYFYVLVMRRLSLWFVPKGG